MFKYNQHSKRGSIALGVVVIVGLIILFVLLFKHSSSPAPIKTISLKPLQGSHFNILNDYNPKTVDTNNYQDKDKIIPVDTTIKTIRDSEYRYANLTNNFKTYFTDQIKKTGNDIKIQKDNASISFQILSRLTIFNKGENDQEVTSAKVDSNSLNFKNIHTSTSLFSNRNRIEYTNVYQKDGAKVDFTYTVHNDRLTEEITLNKFIGFPQFTQNLKLDGVFVSYDKDKTIRFFNKSTRLLMWFIPQPVMFEKNNPKESNNNLHYQVDCLDSSKSLENCDQISITKVIDNDGKKWLADPKRNYPIVIDPNFQIDNADVAANWVSSDPTRLIVSQETTIKTEGTGSVKVVGLGDTSFWGIGGVSDAGCNIATTTPVTVYTSCNSSVCSSGYWNESGCNYTGYTTGSVYSSCSQGSQCGAWEWGGSTSGCSYTSHSTVYEIRYQCNEHDCAGTGCYASGGSCCGSVSANYSSGSCNTGCTATDCGYGNYSYDANSAQTGYWSFTGSCSNGSPATCYKTNGGVSNCYQDVACGGSNCSVSGTAYLSAPTSCSWVAPQHYYDYTIGPQGAATYSGGPCSSDGSGSCYKRGDAYTDYTSASCGSSYCGNTGTYYEVNNCTFQSRYNYSASNIATSYSGTGGPCGSGGTCYRYTGSGTSYSGGSCSASANCSTGSYNTGVALCTWTSDKYSYSVSGSTTRLTGNGPCSTDGSGTCFKLNQDGSNTYTSSGTGGCPSTYCNGESRRYQLNSNCTWFTDSVLNDTVTVTKSPALDLSTTKYITFWIYSNRTGSYLRFQFGEAASGEQTYDFPVNSANTWEKKTWDISAIPAASRNAVVYFAFKIMNASSGFTFYFDDIQAISNPNMPTNCVINESANDTFLKPVWIDNSSDENGFQLEKSTDGGAYSFLTNLGTNVTGYQDSSVSQNHTYGYRIRSYVAGAGTTDFSEYCTFPTLDLHSGNTQYNGVQMNGVQSN